VTGDVLCFSHLRWHFVFQRPQHLLSRCARHHRVFFFEEPVYDGVNTPRLELTTSDDRVRVVVPHLAEADRDRETECLRLLVNELIATERIRLDVLWYYTPMALAFSDHLEAAAVVYDCMDELSNFSGAPPGLRAAEQRLLGRAGVVFTGGHSLYQAKKHFHPNVLLFPSSVDVDHFSLARAIDIAPPDQAAIPAPRIGFFGVIDERLDRDLVAAVATLRPDLSFVFIGPTVKIDPESLPHNPNIHYLGPKPYRELPHYLAGWDVAMLPFARNEATRYISPTKTPEYLAGGKPVVSTSITDVVHPYADLGLALIADAPADFAAAIDEALADDAGRRLLATDQLLATMSWDATWQAMSVHLNALCGKDSASCSTTSWLAPDSPARLLPSVWPQAPEKRF
jgi:glycosyltransferase involved in cell wall biosynthesis